MRSPRPLSDIAGREASRAMTTGQEAAARVASGQGVADPAHAAQGSVLEPVAASGHPARTPAADSPATAQGRRTLSTAFVRIGPDGHLTVELRDGRVLVLRDVTMRPTVYCGVDVFADPGARYCGRYADVVAARPGGGPAIDPSRPAVPNPG